MSWRPHESVSKLQYNKVYFKSVARTEIDSPWANQYRQELFRLMKKRMYINADFYLQLLCMVSAICLLGLTGCSSADARAGKGSQVALVGKMDAHVNEDEDAVFHFGWHGNPPL